MNLEELKRMKASLPGLTEDNWRRELLRRAGAVNLHQELTMRSRYVDTHRDSSTCLDTVPLHSHSFYELIYCRRGNIHYLLGTRRYRVSRGDVIAIPPGVCHRPMVPPGMPGSYDRCVIWLSESFIRNIRKYCPFPARLFEREAALLRTSGSRWGRIGELFANGVSEAEEKIPGWQAAVTGNTLQLLVQLERCLAEAGSILPPPETPDLLDQILSYLETHFAEKITLADTARLFSVSESTISQLFRRRMDVSFYRCVTQRRLLEAKSRILAGDPLEDTAHAVGFSDYSSFYRAFKQEYGLSPNRYRELQGG